MLESCLLGSETTLLHHYRKTNSVPLDMKYILMICKYLYAGKNSAGKRVQICLISHVLLINAQMKKKMRLGKSC